MPSASPADYELVELNDQDLINFTRTQNAAAWRGQLSAEQYIERERVLGKTKICSLKVNRLMVFMLRDKANPTSKLCSIELLIRKSWLYKNIGGKVQRKDVLSGCIGGVFTYPEHRGKGLAQVMVDKLVARAKLDILGEDGFTFLYSEVGEYYTRNGFKSFEVPLLKVPLSQRDATPILGVPGVTTSLAGCSASLLTYHQFGDLLEFHNRQFNDEITAKVLSDHTERVSINPTLDIVDWFHIRAKFISSKIFYQQDIDFTDLSLDEVNDHFHKINPDVFGIQLVNSSGEIIAGIIWTYEFSSDANYVTILKIITDNTSKYSRDELCKELIAQLKTFIETPRDETPKFEFSKLVLWQSEISETVLSWLTGDEFKGVANNSNGSRSAILINNAEDDSKLQKGNLIWEGNDKLPWF